WRFRLVTCQFFDEGILIIVVEYPIVPQLIAHCGKRDCTERLAACTAGTMTGPDLHEFRILIHFLQLIEHRFCAFFRRAYHLGRLFKQIRTPDVTDKEEIPCEYTHRFIASCSAVCQYKGNAFR